MPKLPTNMVKRSGRKGYWFRSRSGGRQVVRFLSLDFEEAKRQLRKHQGFQPVENLTVGDAADRWLTTYVATRRNPRGQKLASQRVERDLKPILGHLLLARLTGEQIRAYRLSLEKRLGQQTVAHLLSDLRCLLLWAEDSGLVQKSPFPRRVMPRIQERLPDRLTTEELELVCSLPDPYGFVCRLLVGSGMRWAESTRALSVHVQSGSLVIEQTKSGRVRRIPLEPQLLKELKSRVGRLNPYSSVSMFNKRVKRTVPRFHAHQLRHSFACQWLEKGRSLAALKEVLGHASIQTTERYARLSDEMIRREVDTKRDTRESQA